jgi:hypothetical protein
MSIILNSSDDSHNKVLFMGGTTSHAARIEFETQNILLLSKVKKKRENTRPRFTHRQLTKHERLLTDLWRKESILPSTAVSQCQWMLWPFCHLTPVAD